MCVLQEWSRPVPQLCGAPALKPNLPSRLNALGVLPPIARPSDCLGRLLFMWECLCVACVGLIIFGVRAVFSIDACHLFPQLMLAVIALIGSVTDVW